MVPPRIFEGLVHLKSISLNSVLNFKTQNEQPQAYPAFQHQKHDWLPQKVKKQNASGRHKTVLAHLAQGRVEMTVATLVTWPKTRIVPQSGSHSHPHANLWNLSFIFTPKICQRVSDAVAIV